MKAKTKAVTYRRFFWDVLRYKPLLTVGSIACNLGIFGYQAAVAYLVRLSLNELESGVRGEAFSGIAVYLAMILAVSVGRVAAILCSAVLDGKRSYYFQNRARVNLLRAIYQREDMTSVAGNSGRIFEVLDDDVPACLFPPELLTEVGGYCLYTLITLGLLLAVNWRVTLFIFLPLSAAIFGIQKMSERMKERRKTNREAHDEVSTFIGDVADSLLSIKTAGAEAAVLEQFTEKNKRRRAAVLRDALLNVKIEAALNLAVHAGVIIMMVAAARLLAGGSFKIGDFSIFVVSLGALGDCVNRIVELIYDSKKAEVSFERILATAQTQSPKRLLEDPGIALKGEIIAPSIARGRSPLAVFEARGLSYSYTGEDGFRDVSLRVRPGELVVIAGGVGSGKSTLLNVLSGNVKAQSGSLCWNGAPIENAGVFCLPPNVASSLQRGRYFSADVETNLCLGAPVGPEAMSRAAVLSAFDDALAELPEGAHTDIGAHGGMLSGGQRQRLALARMFARDAELNIVDDCVSALDASTQLRIRDGIKEHLRASGHGMIMATNLRLFLDAADRVLVLKQGRVVGEGTCEELCAECEELTSIIS